jgi:hypothetical protein
MITTRNFGMTQTINVIDAICGAGKTSWAIQQINDSINKSKKLAFGESLEQEKFIYVTPFLNEVERIKEATNIDFVEPEAVKGYGTKMKHFRGLINAGKSIVTTHELFKKLDIATLDNIEEMGYTLIMDEMVNVLEQYDITKSDIGLLIDNGTIAIGKKGKVQWLDDEYKGKFSDMKILADSDNLILQNGVAMFWTMNTRAFEAFDEVYILTYMFEGQTQCNYYKANDIKFEMFSVHKAGERYELIEYDPTVEPRQKLYNLLNIYEDTDNGKGNPLNSNYDSRKQLNDRQKRGQLSTTWFRNATEDDLKQMNNNLRNYFRNVVPMENNKIFWTTIRDFAPALKNAKCKFNKKDDRSKDNFVPINARATNNYADRTSMAYVYNRFINPMERNFFKEYDVIVDEDKLAVSDLIQFLFRGCIRNDQSMNCYIPSERMRTLLKQWAEYEI